MSVPGNSGDRKGEVGAPVVPTDVKPFVVAPSSSSSDFETSRFRLLNEGVIRSVGAKLSLFLRSEFGFDLDQLDAVELGKYTAKAEAPGN